MIQRSFIYELFLVTNKRLRIFGLYSAKQINSLTYLLTFPKHTSYTLYVSITVETEKPAAINPLRFLHLFTVCLCRHLNDLTTQVRLHANIPLVGQLVYSKAMIDTRHPHAPSVCFLVKLMRIANNATAADD